MTERALVLLVSSLSLFVLPAAGLVCSEDLSYTGAPTNCTIIEGIYVIQDLATGCKTVRASVHHHADPLFFDGNYRSVDHRWTGSDQESYGLVERDFRSELAGQPQFLSAAYVHHRAHPRRR